MEPGSVLLGKLLSSLCYLTLLIMSSAPFMVMCWLLGGIALNEIVMAYGVLLLSAGTFGLVSLGTSSYFSRTSSALMVSYLIILPLALLCLAIWNNAQEEFRVFAGIVLLPPIALVTWAAVGSLVNRRLLYPPDVGSEGKEVIDEDTDQASTMGLVIRRDRFPDWLFAPAKRDDLMEDGTNPVLDKELRSEIFAQGTLMLRVVIQVSMFLSIPLMAIFLFFWPDRVGYYVSYVIVFSMLVGPVFSAGSVTQERERQTLELLLTTLIQPGQIIIAKLISALRVSTVLTLLLTQHIVLAYVMVDDLRGNFLSMFLFFAIILATCLLTSTIGLFCSVLCRKTSAAMILTYLIMLALFLGPLGVKQFLQPFTNLTDAQISRFTVTSPFAAIFSVPLHFRDGTSSTRIISSGGGTGGLLHVDWIYLGFALGLSIVLLILMDVLFRLRWRAASQG
jgi:ABC-type transport system involved in multi-copper enzyme maturation permease subunit